jgi:hypothetical protein
MATSDDEQKTKQELLAELEGLRRRLAAAEPANDAEDEGGSSQPAFTRPITRRTALSNWVAPVILAIPLAAASRPRVAQAQPPTRPEPAAPTRPRAEAPVLSLAGGAAAAAALAGLGVARLMAPSMMKAEALQPTVMKAEALIPTPIMKAEAWNKK